MLRESDPLDPETKGCDVPGCRDAGEYRAPRSRDQLQSYYWFCLEHVRTYNAAWDYYSNMSSEEIESHVRADTTWRRPTWPMGMRSSRFLGGGGFDVEGDIGVFASGQNRGGGTNNGSFFGERKARSDEEKALAVLELRPPISLDAIKARYKELAKQLHPDANGGDKDAEERLKLINQAYSTLKNTIAL